MKRLPIPRVQEPKKLVVTLYPGMAMIVEYGNWRPVSIQQAVDPEARAFAEAFRVLVTRIMRQRLRIPL